MYLSRFLTINNSAGMSAGAVLLKQYVRYGVPLSAARCSPKQETETKLASARVTHIEQKGQRFHDYRNFEY